MSNSLQYKCFSSEALAAFQDLKDEWNYTPLIEGVVFSPLKLVATAVTKIQIDYNLLHEMSNPKTAYKYESIKTKKALIITLVLSVATAVLFGSLFSSVARGINVGAISFFATIFFIKLANFYLLKRECNRLIQEIERQDKNIQSSMFLTEKFCNNYGKFLTLNFDKIILSVKKLTKDPYTNRLNESRHRKAFQELKTLCAFYKVATK
ncbi:MAG: hypothetical protein H0U27_13310 [Nitrosopumilus sp.]|nr:hypothetical protein [Nitrosopumilus sp.]